MFGFKLIPTFWMEKVGSIMARIEESVSALNTAVQEMATRVAQDVAELKAEIDKLTSEDTTRLAALADAIDANVQVLQSIDPVKPEVPPAEPRPSA